MSQNIIADADKRMGKSIAALRAELAGIRAGRAHPGLLENLPVEYYGGRAPLKQAANIAIADARALTVTPWDKSAIAEIEKAIRASDLGLNPVVAGDAIRVPLPQLTEERRRELGRQARAEAERARVAIRNIRRDANSRLREEVKSKAITEDDGRRGEEKIQSLTDARVKEAEGMLADKEKELLAV